MLQRVVILMLVGVVFGAGVTTCPRPATACAMAVQARHDCCNHVALRMSRCCCGTGQRTAQLVSSAGPFQQDQGVKVRVAVFAWQPSRTDAIALTAHRTDVGHGPAPPGTPLQNHIQLLL